MCVCVCGGFEKYTPLSYIYTLPNSVGLRKFMEFFLSCKYQPTTYQSLQVTLRRVQYTGKRSLNEYKNMHYSLHHTRVVRAIVSGLVTIFTVCVCVGIWTGDVPFVGSILTYIRRNVVCNL